WHGFLEVPDRAARLRTFLDAYGSRATPAEAVADLARRGLEPQRTWVAEGFLARNAEHLAWAEAHAAALLLWLSASSRRARRTRRRGSRPRGSAAGRRAPRGRRPAPRPRRTGARSARARRACPPRGRARRPARSRRTAAAGVPRRRRRASR